MRGRYYWVLGGQHWAGWWQAYAGFFREHCRNELDVSAEMWDRSVAYEAASQAGWWWPHRQFVIVSDRPLFIHREQVGPRGWGSHRLHCEDGPAVAWRDGFAVHSWHGVQVPAWVTGADGGPTVERIMAEANAEVRRCAIEALGWDRYIADAGLALVDEADDPANPGHRLGLYDIPDQIFGEPVRVLLCTNASPERDGTRRRFGLTVPGDVHTAVGAAAWTFDLSADEYAQLARAT